jgi:dihydrofolate reductase
VTRVSIIVAVSSNNVIGADGGMPWTLPSDLKNFRRLTMGKPIIMGRKTHESIGRPLDGRVNIVVTRRSDYSPDGVVVCASLEEALAKGHTAATSDGMDEIFIIGGGEIYLAALDNVNRIYLTRVHLDVDGDTVFPELDPETWLETSIGPRTKGPRDSVETSLHVFERR